MSEFTKRKYVIPVEDSKDARRFVSNILEDEGVTDYTITRVQRENLNRADCCENYGYRVYVECRKKMEEK